VNSLHWRPFDPWAVGLVISNISNYSTLITGLKSIPAGAIGREVQGLMSGSKVTSYQLAMSIAFMPMDIVLISNKQSRLYS
jgi:hypothetical protein